MLVIMKTGLFWYLELSVCVGDMKQQTNIRFSLFFKRLKLILYFLIINHDVIYIYITLRYVSVQGSAVSGLQERNRTYWHKICPASCYMIPSIVGGILQSRYQVLLLSCNMFRNRLLTISAYTFRNLHSVTNYMLLSQEFDHWAH
jgi:hypothetical protein